MAKFFEQWTVLKHRPIEKHGDNLWSVHGTMPDEKIRRVMTLARMGDGRVVVHNAIALDEPEMKELEAWGEPAFIVVPNGYHRQDARIWKDRYPKAKVICPEAANKRVAKAVTPAGGYDDVPRDPNVDLSYLDGCKKSEGVLVVRSGDKTTAIFNDALMNERKMSGVMGVFLAPTGRFSVPRVFRWFFMKDKRALGAHLERIAATDGLARIIVSHGATIDQAPADALRAATRELVGG